MIGWEVIYCWMGDWMLLDRGIGVTDAKLRNVAAGMVGCSLKCLPAVQ